MTTEASKKAIKSIVNGSIVTLEFSKSGTENIKETICEILSSAFEARIQNDLADPKCR